MKKRNILALLLAICMIVSLTACGGAESAPASAASVLEGSAVAETLPGTPEAPQEPSVEEEAPYDEVFAIVHTNDVHGYIEVEPYVKAVADDLKAQYGEENVITISAGDVYAGGNAVAHLYNGEKIVPIMDAAGYDLLVPGNNDFNMGSDVLISLAESQTYTTTICGNLSNYAEDGTSEGEPVFEATKVYTTAGGVKVGFFGATTSGGATADLFYNPGTIETAERYTKALQDEGCTVIVGVGHTGWNDDLVTPATNDTTSAAVVKAVPGIDAYVDGHSHSIINGGEGWVCPETGTLVNQASCKGGNIGVMTLYLKDGKVVEKKAELIAEEAMAAYTPDPAVQELVDAAYTQLAEDAGDAYVISEYFLNGNRAADNADGRSIRTDETNLGDLIGDFLVAHTGADVAMVPGFKIRASIPEGPITSVNLYDVFANGGDIFVQEKTGQEILEKMAGSTVDLPNESTQFNQIGGASYGYIKNEDGTVTIVDPMIGGEPLDPEKTYLAALDLGGPDMPTDVDPDISGMEALAEAMGTFLSGPDCVILPDEVTPDNRIVPMDSIPEGAVTYNVTPVAPVGGPGGTPPDGMAGGTPPEGTPPDGLGGGSMGAPPA